MSRHPKRKEWEDNVLNKVLSKFPERQSEFKTVGGLDLNRLGLPETIDDDFLEKLGFPGEYPFTRGVQPTMYRSRLWTMRQYAGFSNAFETNKRYRYLLEQGQTGLSVAFDLPTQIGFDSDHPMSKGEVGKVGVAIDSLADMEVLFDQIPLEKVSTSMTINSPAAVLLAMYVAVGEKQGVPKEKIKGTIQNDVLKEYVARGTYIFPPRPSLRLITNIFEWCSANTPSFNTISISGYHIREAGSTAVQEVAFTLANGCAYVQAAIDAGALPPLGLVGQVEAYVGQAPQFDPEDTLFTIWIGGNDLLEFLRGESSATSPELLIGGAMANIEAAMAALVQAGAKNFLVLNLPDLSKTPAFNRLPEENRADIQALTQGFNQALTASLLGVEYKNSGVSVISINAYSVMNNLIAQGVFANTTDTWLELDANNDPTGNVNGDAEDFLFFDPIHPMTAAHALIGDEAAAAVEASEGARDFDDDDTCFIQTMAAF